MRKEWKRETSSPSSRSSTVIWNLSPHGQGYVKICREGQYVGADKASEGKDKASERKKHLKRRDAMGSGDAWHDLLLEVEAHVLDVDIVVEAAHCGDGGVVKRG